MGGAFEEYPPGTGRTKPLAEPDWAEIAASRKQRAALVPINLPDLAASLARLGERLQFGEPFTVPEYVTVRGTVSAVEIVQGIDAGTEFTVAEIYFRESPAAVRKPNPDLNACTARPDVLQEMFGADFRTSMVGKTIEPRTAQQTDALIAETGAMVNIETKRKAVARLSDACRTEADKVNTAKPYDAAKVAAANQELAACVARAEPAAQQEARIAEQCARDLVKANPAIRTDPLWTGVAACMQAR